MPGKSSLVRVVLIHVLGELVPVGAAHLLQLQLYAVLVALQFQVLLLEDLDVVSDFLYLAVQLLDLPEQVSLFTVPHFPFEVEALGSFEVVYSDAFMVSLLVARKLQEFPLELHLFVVDFHDVVLVLQVVADQFGLQALDFALGYYESFFGFLQLMGDFLVFPLQPGHVIAYLPSLAVILAGVTGQGLVLIYQVDQLNAQVLVLGALLFEVLLDVQEVLLESDEFDFYLFFVV